MTTKKQATATATATATAKANAIAKATARADFLFCWDGGVAKRGI
jgi:hypothetical protein